MKNKCKIRRQVSFRECFTAKHLFVSSSKSMRNVRWKTSVKNHERHQLSDCYNLLSEALSGKHKAPKFRTIVVNERGKTRTVKAIEIKERAVEKCFCDFLLVPNFMPSLSSNNCATLPEQGTWHCIKKAKKYFLRSMRKYGNECYALITDFHDYFHSIDHGILYAMMKERMDEESFSFFRSIVDGMDGLELGSQVSQIAAVIFASPFDRLGERLSCGYVRYMDDTLSFYPTKEKAKAALLQFKRLASEMCLTFSEKKTHIVKTGKGFTFLKKRFLWIPEERKVLVLPLSQTFRTERQRIGRWLRNGVPYEEAEVMLTSWGASLLKIDGYKKAKKTAEEMKRKYKEKQGN